MPYWDEFQGMQYWRDHVLHRSEGAKGTLEVIQDLATRSLCFGNNVRQSTMLLSDPKKLVLSYTRAMMAVEMFLTEEPDSALIIGLGGGSLAKFLHACHPGLNIDVVELREDVVKIAYGYFMLPQDERLRVIVDDGVEFVKRSTNQYDLLFLDMFDHQGMIPEAEDPAFFTACRERLTERGIATVNLWNVQRQRYRVYSTLFHKAFGRDLLRMPLGRRANEIHFGFRKPMTRGYLDHLRNNIAQLEQALELEFSLYLKLLQRHNGPWHKRLYHWML